MHVMKGAKSAFPYQHGEPRSFLNVMSALQCRVRRSHVHRILTVPMSWSGTMAWNGCSSTTSLGFSGPANSSLVLGASQLAKTLAFDLHFGQHQLATSGSVEKHPAALEYFFEGFSNAWFPYDCLMLGSHMSSTSTSSRQVRSSFVHAH